MTLFLVFLGIAVLFFFIGVVRFNNLNNDVSTLFFISGGIFTIVGLLIYPIFIGINDDYKELSNTEILVGKYSVVVLHTTNELNNYESNYFPKSFESQRIKNELNDSTRFFLLTKRSLYRLPTKRKVVWSNPPYKIFYDE